MKAAAPVSLLMLMGLGFLPGSSSVYAQPETEQIERVFRDWQKRQERIPRIRYVVRGHSIRPKGSITDNMGRPLVPPQPSEDIAQKQDTILLLDIPGKRFRMEQDQQRDQYGEKKLVPLLKTEVFDGNSLFGDFPREANARAGNVRGPLEPDISIAKNYSACRPLKTINAFWLSPLLFAHGFVDQLTVPPSFVDKLDVDDFHVCGQVVHEGKSCLVLRTYPVSSGTGKSFDEYWVDLARDSAVVRNLAYMDDKLYTDVEIAYQQTSHGWLPLRWVGMTRDYTKGSLINVTRLRVQEYTIEPTVSDADFRVEIKPGMIIWETDYGGPVVDSQALVRKKYRVASDGSWQEIGQQGETLPPPWWRRWLALAEVVALMVVGCLLWHRWRAGPARRLPSPAP